MINIEGDQISLESFQGKVLLIVNVASRCGYTSQYESLQQLYDQYRGRGFEILGFPANNFGMQESGTNEEILEFCAPRGGWAFLVGCRLGSFWLTAMWRWLLCLSARGGTSLSGYDSHCAPASG